MVLLKKYLLVFFLLLAISLSLSNCYRSYNRYPPSEAVEKYFVKEEFAKAYELLLATKDKVKNKDYLLHLLERGSILYTLGDWEQSAKIFAEALEFSDAQTGKRTKEVLAFLVNDRKKLFIGEDFERVLIYLYLGLSQVQLEKKQLALQTFKRMSDELSDIRDFKESYRGNAAARYLHAIVAEDLGSFSEARVEYNNLLQDANYANIAKGELFYLSHKTSDFDEVKRYAEFREQLPSLNLASANGDKPLTWKKDFQQFGSIVLLNLSGLAPFKVSRGKIANDKEFDTQLHIIAPTTLRSNDIRFISTAALIPLVLKAENPIPEYKTRDRHAALMTPSFMLNQQPLTLRPFDSYTETVLKNYNDAYPKLVAKNTTSILLKMLGVLALAYGSDYAISQSGDSDNSFYGSIAGLFISLIGSAAVANSIRPDLRSWSLNYDRLDMLRIRLPAGSYTLQSNITNTKISYLSKLPETIEVQKNKTTFILMRSF